MNTKLKPTIMALALMLAVCLLFPSAALAQGTNCPPEPASGTPIADGQIYAGTNCTLTSPGDVDGFVFVGNNGETYHTVLAINGSATTNICLTLYDPNDHNIFFGCTSIGYPNYVYSVVVNQALTVTGTYTIDITETSTAAISYALSLERLYPFPPNAQQINLETQYPGDITPVSDSNAFTWQGATTGMYQVSATVPSNASQNVCMSVFSPTGTLVQNYVCTSVGYPNYVYTINIDFTPTQNGTYMAFFQVAGNDGTVTYTMEVSCIVGSCPAPMYPDVEGYILLQGVPLANTGVSLSQSGAPGPQLTMTNSIGYYQFQTIIPGEPFSVVIHGPAIDSPTSGKTNSTNDLNKNRN